MAMAPKPFPFVAIEGLDGSGKTQARRWIFAHLERQRREPVAIIQNGWLDVAATRTITAARYFDELPADLDELADAYRADKHSLSERIIRPHRAVRPIVADRFLLSDVVYNDVLFGIDWRRTRDLYLASRIERPSHTLFVRVSPELCAERLAQRAGAPAWKWERLETQKRVASLFEVVLDDPATRPLYGRLERIANEGSLRAFEARIDAFAAGLIAREPEPRSGDPVMRRERAWQQLATGMHVHRYFLAPYRFRKGRADPGLLALLAPVASEAAALTLCELVATGRIARSDLEALVRGDAQRTGWPWRGDVAVYRRGVPAFEHDVQDATASALRLLAASEMAPFVELLLGCLWVVDDGAEPLQEALTGVHGCVVVEEGRLDARDLARRIAAVVVEDLFSLMAVEDAARGDLPLDLRGGPRTPDEEGVRRALRSHAARCLDENGVAARPSDPDAAGLRVLIDRLPSLDVRQFALTNTDCAGRFSLYEVGLGVGQAD
ncbi:MAG TPA: hypothetical protein VIN04_06370 [Myxococcota bacterium]